MARKDVITMSQRELKRLYIVHKLLDKRLRQVEATDLLGLSERQIRRIVKKVKKEGEAGVIHKSRGKLSHNRIPEKTKQKVISLYKNKYRGFGPLLFSEKLFEIDKVRISNETLRKWLIEARQWTKRRKHKQHRQWRERKKHSGQMIQVDGSHHDWFEERGPKCVLMAYIDDATSIVFARFYDYEGTFPFMDSFKRYIRKYGLPHSIYLDKHTTYKSTKKPSIKDELSDTEPLSEVGRALNELEVRIIYAHSPQAKGRVERLFRTFQDRVIKEMRLRSIRNIKQANKFLTHYLPVFNKRFSVRAVEKDNIHRNVPKRIDLNSILCIKTERALRNDFTVAHNNRLYQVLNHINARRVVVEERMNGKIFIDHKDSKLKYKEIAKRPKKQVESKPYIPAIPKKLYIPPQDHPWRKVKIAGYSQNCTYPQKEKVGQKEKELLLTVT